MCILLFYSADHLWNFVIVSLVDILEIRKCLHIVTNFMVFFHCQVPPLVVTSQSSASPSKAALVRLLTKIRKQKDHGTTRSESSDASKEVTIESGSITSDKTKHGTSSKSATNASVSEEHPELLSVPSHYNKRKFCFKKILFEILFRFHFHQNLYLTVMWPKILIF